MRFGAPVAVVLLFAADGARRDVRSTDGIGMVMSVGCGKFDRGRIRDNSGSSSFPHWDLNGSFVFNLLNRCFVLDGPHNLTESSNPHVAMIGSVGCGYRTSGRK